MLHRRTDKFTDYVFIFISLCFLFPYNVAYFGLQDFCTMCTSVCIYNIITTETCMNNFVHLTTEQYTAGKPWIKTFLSMLLETNTLAD